MTDRGAPAHDEVGGLLDQARREADDERRGDLLSEITDAGRGVVRAIVERLLVSDEPRERALGADLVSAMPGGVDEETRKLFREQGWPLVAAEPFDAEDRTAIEAVLRRAFDRANDSETLQALIVAVGKLERATMADVVGGHIADARAEVRRRCAWTFTQLAREHPVGPVVDALITLADDRDDEVRQWAMSGLAGGRIDPVDTAAARSIFRRHVDDTDPDVREDAVAALGVLGDVEMLATALAYEDVTPRNGGCGGGLGGSRAPCPTCGAQ